MVPDAGSRPRAPVAARGPNPQTVPMRSIAGCLAVPRVVLILVWFLTDYLDQAYDGRYLWLVLGFFFMPLTALAYGLCHHYGITSEDWWVAIVIVAALFDLGLVGGLKRKKDD